MHDYKDMIAAGTLTRNADALTSVTASTPETLVAPVAAKAVRLYCATADILLETAVGTPDDPEAGSLIIPAGTPEWIPLLQRSTIKIDVSATADVNVVWLS